MSGLSVLKVFVPGTDLFKMFNSTIGTFHHTSEHTLLCSSLAGIRWLSTVSVRVLRQTYLSIYLVPTVVVRFLILVFEGRI